MSVKSPALSVSRPSWTQIFIFIVGLFYTFTALSMLWSPDWFYQTIGYFPPFNRHFIGDLGTFNLPLGLGLLLAAQNPSQHRLLLWVAAGANLFHSLNHMYDSIAGQMSLAWWLKDTIPLIVVAVLFFVAIRPATREQKVKI
jgi:hypothetical protein